ncbi:MAG: hypothetical protein QGI21_02380 [Candidatus Poseidoniaceae archaeon]|nr:hypothetical protein [Candidatus Poseidoniaceae archaeon]
MWNKYVPALFFVLLLPLVSPVVSAAGMQGCTINGGICDEWDKADDQTPNQQDWIEGVYEFNMVNTSTINVQMTWALREFNRTTLGLDYAAMNIALAAEGMSPVDGVPADLIRNYFDQTTAGPGTPTVRDKLLLEVNDTVDELLENGFGTVTEIIAGYTSSINQSGNITQCSDDPDFDTAAEAGLEDNVFDPPICFSVSAEVVVSPSTFNLGSVDPLTLERVYQGMLAMGSDISSEFSLFSDPGHKSTFVIHPPQYATVKGVDAPGHSVIRSGPPSYLAAEWIISHLDASVGEDRKSESARILIGYRNSTQTSSVSISPDDTGITLRVILDLSDEDAASIEILAGINHFDEDTMDDWGISLVDVTQNANVPWVTSDGIRMAHHNGLVDLNEFTSNFPMDTVSEAIKGAVSDAEPITMTDPVWVSDSATQGLDAIPGGLNYTHGDCPENLPVGMEIHYCVEGPNAMDGFAPIYLQSTSNTFTLHLLDLIKQKINDDYGIMDIIQESDLEDLLDSGLEIEADLGQSFVSDMIPSELPPTELSLEIIMPSWLQTATGEQSLLFVDRPVGDDEMELSMIGPNAYDPRHSIMDGDKEICSGHDSEWSCINVDMEIDAQDLTINEWSPSVDFTGSFEANIDVYRIKVPNYLRDDMNSNGVSVDLEVIPSDLIRVGLDISERVEEPITREVVFSDGETASVTLTKKGIEDFVSDIGEKFTEDLHERAREANEHPDAGDVNLNLDNVQIITSLENLGNIGTSIDDQTPLRLKIVIPTVTLNAGVSNGWGGISDGNPKVSVNSEIVSPIFQIAQMFGNLLFDVGLQSLNMSGDGFRILDGEESFNLHIQPSDLTLNEDTDMSLRGEVTLKLPEGILLENFQTANGWETVEMVDGRQVITMSFDSFANGEDVTFTILLTWGFVLSQIWIYPTILLGLIVWRVRARWKKKKIKRTQDKSSNTAIIGKGGLSDDEFAQLESRATASETDFDLYSDDIWDYS